MDDTSLQEYIQEFVQTLGISIDAVEIVTTGAHTMFNIRTADSKQLIGPHGDHLRSLNYLIRRSVEKKTGEKDSKFMIDVNGYQHKHIQSIEQKAKLLADRVRTFKSSAAMTPMSAYERMIVHSLFSEDSEIATESEGVGKARHIVLRYAQ